MQSVYQAANGLEAQIVVDVLAGHGIHAFVQGAGLGSVAGELPTLGVVRVLVSDASQAAEAITIIREWEAHKPEPEPDTPEAAVTSEPVPRPRAPSAAWFAIGALAGAFVATLVAGAREHSHTAEGNVVWTWDGDRLARGEFDFNADGRADTVNVYGAIQGNYLQTSDNDYDGRMEVETRYRNDVPQTASTDHDGDGFSEHREVYSGWLVTEESWLDPKTRNVTLRTRYERGVPATSEIDSDGDGRFDTLRQHDHRGEIVSSRPM